MFAYYIKSILLAAIPLLFYTCSSTKNTLQEDKNISRNYNNTVKILSIGDSYTIGESVCNMCRFPEQLKEELQQHLPAYNFDLKIIAETGWTTTNLIKAINKEHIASNYNLVTLLIGVNNQYQNKPFSLYKTEFPKLLDIAITAANSNKRNVIVISIPDYAYTPFGQKGNPSKISEELNAYNSFAEQYCNAQDITYINITDITRKGLINPNLVAADGLHPSKAAYYQFVKRLLPSALDKIQN